MTASLTKFSTIVRLYAVRSWLRASFGLGSVFLPRQTLQRAGRLFSTPLPGSRRRALLVATRHAVETSLPFAGEHIHTYVWGDPSAQPYVLLAHGWSSHGTRFLPWVDRLRKAGYAVVAFDQPGHGRSSGQRVTLADFSDTLLMVGARFGPAAAVIGHSLGGAAAASAMANGLVANRVVLIAPAADPVAATIRFAHVIGLPGWLRRRMVTMFEGVVGVPFAQFQAQHNAPHIGRPALIVHDLHDLDVPWAEGECYARFWPDSRLLSTQGLGHNRIVHDDRVIAAALRFLHGETVGERVVSTPDLPYGIA